MPEMSSAAHNVIIENRKRISISGVTDVGSFDEETLNIVSADGSITVKGENLQVTKLSLESGELCAEGEINAVIYSASPVKGKGLFSKMFG